MKTCISQEPNVIKNRNWYQMIAITIFYNYTIRYINKLTLLERKYLRELKKNHWQTKGYTNKTADISVTKSSRELKFESNNC